MDTKLFEEFKAYYNEIKNYTDASTLISWELHTEVPRKGVDRLVNLSSFYSGKAFQMGSSDKMGEYLDKLSKDDKDMPEEWKASIKRLAKKYRQDKNVPVDFYEAYVKNIAEAEDVWQNAKRMDDYASFEPYLKKIIEDTKQLCQYRNPDRKPYDTLLDEYEEGMGREEIDELFSKLKEQLIPLVQAITQKKEPDSTKFTGEFDINKQKEFSRYLLEYIGFDMNAGVMSESEHPFTTGVSGDDVRITNHYDEKNIINPMFSIIHEGGHGIFMQNIDSKYKETPLADCQYMGLHESQSRFYENILGRNINFWKPIYKRLQETFTQYEDITLEEFYREINHVKNSLIRIDADELTYCFHIIVRYEIERELFDGDIEVDDIPKVWNEKMQEYLGIVPRKDSEGALQDSHWSGGAFGYFPSYLLGSIYDGMLLEKIEEELGDIDKLLSEGRIGDITKWLNTNIHCEGSNAVPKELIEKICGKKITVEPLVKYFEKKYKELYDL